MRRNSIVLVIFESLVLTLLLGIGNLFGQSNSVPVKKTKMTEIVQNFYQIRERTLDERGTENDVSQLLKLMADDIVYEHPVANAKLNKEQVKGGMMAHLKEGKNAVIKLYNFFEGKDFVIAETGLEYTVGDKQIKRRGVAIFEFSKGKIKRVAEY